MKATEQYILVVLFSVLRKVVLTFAGVCRWNPKLWRFKWKLVSSTFISYATVYYAAQDGSIFLC